MAGKRIVIQSELLAKFQMDDAGNILFDGRVLSPAPLKTQPVVNSQGQTINYGIDFEIDANGDEIITLQTGNADASVIAQVRVTSEGNANITIIDTREGSAKQKGISFELTGGVVIFDSTNQGLQDDDDYTAFQTTTDWAQASTKAVKMLINSGPQKHTTAERLTLTPSEGEQCYDTTLHKLFVYDGTTWQACW